ncbi:MAG: hypothetical protein PHU44_06905 [Syntrophales bacterium]|nr:hypothetical protein [Syntrophales bacterium]MDD5643344.1 hypothetical protein [Syntrophales bacterium]
MTQKKLLLYVPVAGGVGYRLTEAVGAALPQQEVEVVQTLDALSNRLQQPLNGLELAVLLSASQRQLFDFLTLRPLPDRLRIILVLPDAKPETISLGHSLQPRFVTYIHSDFQDVAAVLRKIMKSAPSTGYVYLSPSKA